MKGQKWTLVKHFSGTPEDDDLKLIEEDVPDLQDGDVLFEALYLSVDPYMRIFSGGLPLGSVMMGEQLARVKETKNAAFEKDKLYLGNFGWKTHTVVNPDKTDHVIKEAPAMGSLPLSLTLGTVGMTGATAHITLLQLARLKSDDTVLITGAAGAVGHVAGQIAKIKGCTVIGIAGSTEKVSWLKELGFDHAFNYKTDDLRQCLTDVAPEGVDVFLDGVGGDFSLNVVHKHMRMNGRVVMIGAMSEYNRTTPTEGPGFNPLGSVMAKRLHIHGFVIYDVEQEHWNKSYTDIIQWINEDKLQYRERIFEGFENMRTAFYSLFTGQNLGKVVVKV